MILTTTGHRPDLLCGWNRYTSDFLMSLTSFARAQLEWLNPNVVITGGKQGWDTAAAFAVHAMKQEGRKIELWLALPFPGFEDRWLSVRHQKQLNWIINHSDMVEWMEFEYVPNAYRRQVDWMVSKADMLLVLWNGQRDWVQSVVKLADRKKKQVHNCWEDWVGFKDSSGAGFTAVSGPSS